MAGVKVSEYTELASLVGDELIPTGTGVRKATTPDQLKAFIGNSASKLTDLTDVDAGAAGSADGKFLTELAPVAGERQFGFVDATVAVGDVVGLQAELDTKEATIVAATASDYYRGDKTFQPLNKAAVGLSSVDNTSDLAKPLSTSAITALAGKLSEVVTPSVAAGEALTMVKSGTNGQMKKLIAGQDTTLSSTADTVTVGTTGRTLKDFVEVSETVNSKFYRYLVPNASATPSNTPVHVRLVGRSSTASGKFSLAITDAASAFEKVNTGLGSVDLQINRDAINQTASGLNNFVGGAFNRVTGDNNVVLGCGSISVLGSFVSGSGNVILGTQSTVSGGGNLLLVTSSNVTGNNNKVFGANGTAGTSNVLLGEGGGVTGNGCTAIHSGSSFGSTRTTRGMSRVHTQSTSPSTNSFDAGQQNLEALYQFAPAGLLSDVTWVTLTSDRLAVGTTNVYVLSSFASVAFIGYVVISTFGTYSQDSYIYKLEGAYAEGSVAFTQTLVKAAGVATYDIQVVVSSGKLLVQVKASAGATDVAANHARANIRFFELCGQS